MPELDHVILRVSKASASAQFYRLVLGLRHEGQLGPFEVLRVNAGCTIDLLAESPKDPAHLAFRLTKADFDALRARLQRLGIAFGGGPFVRDGLTAAQQGARGWAEALYFSDPDQHNIEVRKHVESSR